MIEKKSLDILFIQGLLLGFILIPFIRLCSGLFQHQLPYQYVPIVAFSFLYLVVNARGNFLLFSLLNLAYLIFNLINSTALSEVKMQIAAFTYINSFLSIYLFFKKNENSRETFLRFYVKPLFYTSLLLMLICILSLGLNIWNHPFSFSIKDLLDYISFARVNVSPFRSGILMRLNPLGAVFNNIENIQYIGPQLIINPLIAYILLKLFPSVIEKKYLKIIFSGILILLILITNSRAILLSFFLFTAIISFKNIKLLKSPLLPILFVPFPFIQYLLSEKFISGRMCQYNFVKNNLSLFGNGVGSGISELNSTCGEFKHLGRLQSIQSYCFDNIHLEFLHYFGFFGYFILLLSSVYFIYKYRTIHTLLIVMFGYFFLSLNLNLFEIYFVPMFVVLFCLASKPQLEPSQC